MLMRILFYLLLYPLSVLPLKIIYFIFWIFYLFVNYIFRYRHKVTTENLSKSFPEMTERQIRRLRTLNYRHLTQIAAEMLKMLSISRKNLMRRYYCTNPEVVNRFYDEGRSVILVSSHYNNWEWMVLSIDMQFKHQGVGVGAHNSNKVFEKLINKARSRYGDHIVFADNVRDVVKNYIDEKKPAAFLFLTDQNPSNPHRCYVTDFLNRKTGFIRGAEGFARKYDLPVIYYEVIKDKPGYYHFETKILSEHPQQEPEGAIMQRYAEELEATIRRKPEYWLWTHRRWKHKFD